VYCCEDCFCTTDTTRATDTIVVGEKFLGELYAIGRHDSIFETIAQPDGCDSVVMHTLIVKPDPKVLNYYVKTSRQGKGDGSSWEDAMDGKDFAACLPLAPDGATFYVAEGRYMPVYESDGNFQYSVNSSVSIIGGFPAQASFGAKSDPEIFKTVFSGDPSGDDVFDESAEVGSISSAIVDSSGDDLNVFHLFSAVSSKLYFYGCNFIGVSLHSDDYKHVSCPIFCNDLKVEKCVFDLVGTLWTEGVGSKLEATECIFLNKPSVTSPSTIFEHDTVVVEKSLFEGMKGTSGGIFGRNDCVIVRNSTFNNILSSRGSFFNRARYFIYNNTFVNLRLDGGAYGAMLHNFDDTTEFVGNLLKNCEYKSLLEEKAETAIVKNNLCENVKATEQDLQIDDLENYLLEGSYDSKTKEFVPTIKYNGGFTPTVALKADTLPDGRSIRFPLSETTVTTDQRGVKRLEQTCMGAYEIGCSSDTTLATDTLIAGVPFIDGVVYTVGRHDSIFETITLPNGCDSVVMHTLVVKPNPEVKEYYVKTTRQGAGDGSSWENAMDGKDFAACLPLASDGATFYVAEGEYMPDSEYSKQSDGVYFTTDAINVSIVGGFSTDIKRDTLSDPQKYETILRSVEKAERCIVSNSTNFYGVVFESPLLVRFPGNKTVTFDKCTFREIDAAHYYTPSTGSSIVAHCQTPESIIEFRECQFLNNKSTLLQGYQTPYNVGVDKYYGCSFVGNEADILFYLPGLFSGSSDLYEIVNCTFSKNKAKQFFSFHGGLRLYNNSFFNNEADVFLYDQSYDNSESSTIVGNVFLKNDFTAILDGGDRTTSSSYFDLVKHNLFQEMAVFSTWPDNINLSGAENQGNNLFDLDASGEFVLKNNGGFTPTVALKSDRLPDGRSIRFPLSETTVTTDQRGVKRLEQTCMGAYELVKDTCQSKLRVDITDISPSICLDGPYAGVEFNVGGNTENDVIYVEMLDSTGKVAYGAGVTASTSFKDESEWIRFYSFYPGKYTVHLYNGEKASCVQDTSFAVELPNADTLRVSGLDTLYTECLSESTAEIDLHVDGFHPSFSFYLNGRTVKRYGYPDYTEWFSSVDSENAKGIVHLGKLPVGEYVLGAVDYCGNRYDTLKNFVVVGPEPMKLTKEGESIDSLYCSGDKNGSIQLNLEGGTDYARLYMEHNGRVTVYDKDSASSVLILSDLEKGDYLFRYATDSEFCSDGDTVLFTVKAPEPLQVNAMVNGILCKDAVIEASTVGESGRYAYEWVKPDGDTIKTAGNVLADVGAGFYEVKVIDAFGCSVKSEVVNVLPPDGLSKLSMSIGVTSQRCFGLDDAIVEVDYQNNNKSQAVTCVLKNLETGEQKTKTSARKFGTFIFKNQKPGSYVVTLRYGTATCDLGLDELTETIEVDERAKPLEFDVQEIRSATCLSNPNGAFKLNIYGWSPDYTAYFDGKEVNPSVSESDDAHIMIGKLKGGNYRLRVDDGCEVNPVFIDIDIPTISKHKLELADSDDSLVCGRDKGFVSLSVSGGNKGVDYVRCEETGTRYLIDADKVVKFDGLGKGDYHFIYESGEEDCTNDYAMVAHSVSAPDTLSGELVLDGINCSQEALRMEAKGETRPYMYKWRSDNVSYTGKSSVCPFDLDFGREYKCLVYDAKGCDTIARSFAIPEEESFPALKIAGSAESELCYRGFNGSVKAVVTPQGALSGSVSVTIGLKMLGVLPVKMEKTVTCREKCGVSASPLIPGKYVLSAHYGKGDCVIGTPVYDTVIVEALRKPAVSLVSKKDINCLSRPDGAAVVEVDGWARTHKVVWARVDLSNLSVSGGVLPAPVSVSGQNARIKLKNLKRGTYFLAVEDKCGTSSNTLVFSVKENAKAYGIDVLASSKLNLKCNYTSDGYVNLKLSGGGLGHDQFSMNGASPVTVEGDTMLSIKDLAAGTYKFRYSSTLEGCPDNAVETVTVAPANKLTQALLLDGKECENQRLLAQIDGGTAPYKVSWKTGNGNLIETDNGNLYELKGAGTGSFFFEVEDKNGCEYSSDTVDAALIDLDNLLLKMDSVFVRNTKCYGSEDGAVFVRYSGNKALSNIKVSMFSESLGLLRTEVVADKAGEVKFDSVSYGAYKVKVSFADAEECSLGDDFTASVKVGQPEKLETVVSFVPVICDTLRGGKTVAVAKGGIAPYRFVWKKDEAVMRDKLVLGTEDTLTGLAQDSSYYCLVYDSNDCEAKTEVVTISRLDLQELVSSDFFYTKTVLCSGAENAYASIKLAKRDNRVPVRFEMFKDGVSAGMAIIGTAEDEGLIDGLAPGSYSVTLSYDDDGCVAVLDSNIAISDLKPLSMSDISLDRQVTCINPANGVMSFSVEGWAGTHRARLESGEKIVPIAPDSVDEESQIAFFKLNRLSGGELIAVRDFCETEVQGKSPLTSLENLEIKILDSYTNLKCDYSTNGYVDLKVVGGAPDLNALWAYRSGDKEYVTDTLSRKDGVELRKKYDNLRKGSYYFVYKSTEDGCLDSVNQNVIVKAPAPIVFKSAVKPAACKNVYSGEIAVVPYKSGVGVSEVLLENSANYALELVDGKKDELKKAFPGVVSVDIFKKEGGRKRSVLAKFDTLMYSCKENNEDCERVEKIFPYKGLWKVKQGEYYCPKNWIGFESLPADIYWIEVSDDSACVFSDTFKVDDPKYGSLRITDVKYDSEAAKCHAEKRYVEVYVSGGWGKYLYSINPRGKKEENDEFGSVNRTYISGDSTWHGDGKGYYKSAILVPGSYQVEVIDSLGCKDSFATILDVDANILVDGDVIASKCGGSDSEIDVRTSVSGNYSVYEPYGYAIRYEDTSIGDTLNLGTVNAKVTGVPKGIIGIYAYDSNGCSGYSTFNVDGTDSSFVPFVAYVDETVPLLCNGDESGVLKVRAFGAYPPYESFYVDDIETMASVNLYAPDGASGEASDEFAVQTYEISVHNLAGGVHTLKIVDSEGCEKEVEYTIEEPRKLTADVKASPVCPNSDFGKISVKVSGGVEPYRYRLDSDGEDDFQANSFVAAERNELHSVIVRDTNGCEFETATTAVTGTFDASGLTQSCLVSTWHNFDDVIVFIDNSSVPNYYDSTNFVLKGVHDSVKYEEVDPVLFTYGIPDTLESVVLWNGDTLDGPLWGVPTDIAAGVKTAVEYSLMDKVLQDSLMFLKKNLEKAKTVDEKDELERLCLGVKRQMRANCTLDMIKSTFKPLVNTEMRNRMTFFKFSTKNLNSIVAEDDKVLFKYGFEHILYVNGCDLRDEYNDGVKIANDGYLPYEDIRARDIMAFSVSPNPLEAENGVSEDCYAYVTLSKVEDFEIKAYDMIGNEVEEFSFDKLDDGMRTDDGYVYKCKLKGLSRTSVVVVSTQTDKASETVIVTSGF
jgi:hypothetical protein